MPLFEPMSHALQVKKSISETAAPKPDFLPDSYTNFTPLLLFGHKPRSLAIVEDSFFFCFFFRLSIMIRILSNYLRQQISPLLTTCQLQLWNLLRLSPDEFCQLCLLSERNFKFSFKGAFVILASRSPTRQSAKKYTGESCEKEIPLLLFNVLEGKLTIECLVQ